MKTRLYLIALLLYGVSNLTVPAASYTNTLVAGYNLVANPLAVSIYYLIPNPDEFLGLAKWNPTNQAFDNYYYWFLGAWTPSDPVLAPGDCALIQTGTHPNKYPQTFSISGVEQTPVLPISFTRDSYRAVSRQLPDIGTYENIVGLPPEIGSRFIRLDRNQQLWITNTFNGSAWSLGNPSVAAGEGVLIYFPPVLRPLMLTNATFDAANGGTFSVEVIGTSNVLTRVEYTTIMGGTNWTSVTNYAPSSGRFYITNGLDSPGNRFYRALYEF